MARVKVRASVASVAAAATDTGTIIFAEVLVGSAVIFADILARVFACGLSLGLRRLRFPFANVERRLLSRGNHFFLVGSGLVLFRSLCYYTESHH
jgi:hypothetical protein